MRLVKLADIANIRPYAPGEWVIIDLGSESWIEYIPEAIEDSEAMFDEMQAKRPREASEIIMFGKSIAIPRRQRMYGRPYTYSGVLIPAEEDMPALAEAVLLYSQLFMKDTRYAYQGVLANWYKDGSEYIGAHSDDESALSGGPILSFSFGAARIFRLRRKTPGKTSNPIVLDLVLGNGSLVVMGGKMQEHFQHEVPASKKIAVPRINLTVRSFEEKMKSCEP